MTSIPEKLKELDLELPNIPRPLGQFVPFTRAGNVVFLSGQVCEWNGTIRYRGKLGIDHDLETAQVAAQLCALNLLASLQLACAGDWSRVRRCLRLGGFVNCVPDYPDVPKVINGASNLMLTLFGEGGPHARTSVGVATLPACALVEVDGIFEVVAEH